MNPSDCGDLLRACAFYDNRKVTKEAMVAWSHAIQSDVTKHDALQAIADHHGESTEYILPVHINRRVKAIRRERLQRAGTPPVPGGLTQAQEREWTRVWCAQVKNGHAPDRAAWMASTEMGVPPELPLADRVAQLSALLATSKGINQ